MRWLDVIANSPDKILDKLWMAVGTGGLACCGPWGHEESDVTWRLNSETGKLRV